MLPPAGLILVALCAQTPGSVVIETSSVSEDPFDALWAPDPDAPLPSRAAPSDGPPGATPRDTMGPGAPRLDLDAPASAAPAPPTVVQRKIVRRWYRWPIVISDLLFATVTFIGFGLENTPLVATGALGYAFAAPAWHWKNGNLNGGLLSLTMHSLGPVAVGLLGALFGAVANGSDCANGNCRSDRPWFFGGVAVGVAGTLVMDAFVLAYVDEDAPLSAAPMIGRVGEVTTFGVGGRF